MMGSGVFAGVFDLDDGAGARRRRRHDASARRCSASAMPASARPASAPVGGLFRGAYRAGADPRGRRARPSAWCRARRASAGTTSPSPARRRMPARRRCRAGRTRWSAPPPDRGGEPHRPCDNQPYACATVGFVQVSPNSRNMIPGRVFFTVDFRHPKDATLTTMDASCARRARRSRRRREPRRRGRRSSGTSRRAPFDAGLRRRGAQAPRRRWATRTATSSAAPATTPSTWRASRRPR